MSKTEKHLLTLWLTVNLLIGLFIVRDFGISYDEPDYYLYAQSTVDAYRSFFALAYTPVFGPHDLPNYGPAFIIFPELILRLFQAIFPNLIASDLWHFSYFLVFQLGGLCLYALARRWFDVWIAWGVLLLYTTQPLLWGHAFINPKDIPFMAFFLFTIWSGFRMADSLGAQQSAPAFKVPGKISLPRFRVRDSFPYFRSREVVVAGILLGMTMSIRLLGPLPGLIVIFYLAFTLRQHWLSVTIAYLLCAGIAMFLTWPYLWPAPIGHWMDSLVLMVNFPWPAWTLFDGQFYEPDKLPLAYLPVLLNIQLTESLLVLAYPGLAVLVLRFLQRRMPLDLFLTIVVGGLLPLAALLLSRATMYDNFRQILFLLPPLILLAGLALDWLFTLLKPTVLRLILLIVLAFSGVYAIARLHPYQYVYYNSMVGGTGGAFRRFELDYWLTSYREAALWLNENVPANAKIGANGPAHLLTPYLRPDLVAQPAASDGQYDYFVNTSRYNQDLTFYPDAPVLYTVERHGAVLAAVKQLVP